MRTDAQALAAIPDYVQLDALLKARPATEGSRRFLYLEASNEDLDYANEITLQKALMESADYYLRHGNVDIDHYTLTGVNRGMADYLEYEIGKPRDVRVDGKTTFVKAELYTGTSPQARKADTVWQSMTAQQPPASWYPSVGGAVLAKSMQLDPRTGNKIGVITKVRWNNIALSRVPVNKTVGTASTMPVGVFAKSLAGVSGILVSGYGTDSGAMTGGRALSTQSLDRAVKSPWGDYFGFRDVLAKAVSTASVASASRAGLIAYAVEQMGVDEQKAAGLVERFLQDLRSMTKKESA